jgi:hypothetical protein
LVFNGTVFGGVNGKVPAHKSANARTLCLAHLSNNNVTGFNCFTAKHLKTQPLAGTILGIFAGTTSFNM